MSSSAHGVTEEDWNFDGQYLQHKKVRSKPKPFGGSRPIIMNAGASPNGRAFALKNCDAFFTTPSRVSDDETRDKVLAIKERGRFVRAGDRCIYRRCRDLPPNDEGSDRTTFTMLRSNAATGMRCATFSRSRTFRPNWSVRKPMTNIGSDMHPAVWAAQRSSATPIMWPNTLIGWSRAGLRGAGHVDGELPRRTALFRAGGFAAAGTRWRALRHCHS